MRFPCEVAGWEALQSHCDTSSNNTMISTGDSASTQLNLMFTVSFDVGFTHASLLLEWMATDHGFAIDMPLRSDEASIHGNSEKSKAVVDDITCTLQVDV